MITITPVTDHEEYTLNGHTIYKDHFGNWTCKVELSHKELLAFQLYRKRVIDNKAFKKHTKAVYK